MNIPTPSPGNAPTPVVGAAPQVPQPVDPTTPGPQPKPSALAAATTTALAGTPAAALVVWGLATYGHVTDPVAAATLGSVIASVAGYLWRIAQALLTKWGINPGS